LYRGHNIHDIAERLSFEETVFLLWQGRLPTMDEGPAFGDELATYRAVPEAVLDLLRITPEYAHPMPALPPAVSMLACVHPGQEAKRTSSRPRSSWLRSRPSWPRSTASARGSSRFRRTPTYRMWRTTCIC